MTRNHSHAPVQHVFVVELVVRVGHERSRARAEVHDSRLREREPAGAQRRAHL